MSLIITNLHKEGAAKNEYIVLQASADLYLDDYALVDRTFKGKEISNIHRHVFRFPERKRLLKGEHVVVYSGIGVPGPDVFSDNKTPYYRYHWGSKAPIFNDEEVESVEVWNVRTVARKDK